MTESLGTAVPDTTYLLLKGAGMLFIVLALLLFFLFLFRKVAGVRPGGMVRMQVLGAIQLGARERAVLISVRGRELLLGVTPQSVRTLAEFSGEKIEEDMPESPAFGGVLSRVLGGKWKTETKEEEGA